MKLCFFLLFCVFCTSLSLAKESTVKNSTLYTYGKSYANNSKLLPKGFFWIRANGDFVRSFKKAELGTNIFTLLNSSPNINIKYQIFAFKTHEFSVHLQSIFSSSSINSVDRFISSSTGKLIESDVRSFYQFYHHIKFVETLSYNKKLEFSLGLGDVVFSSLLKGEYRENMLKHRFYCFFSMQHLLRKELSLQVSLFFPIYYLQDNVTYLYDVEVHAVLNPYYKIYLSWYYGRFSVDLGLAAFPLGLGSMINMRSSFLYIRKERPKKEKYFYTPILNISWKI